jgi:hypothetical protein
MDDFSRFGLNGFDQFSNEEPPAPGTSGFTERLGGIPVIASRRQDPGNTTEYILQYMMEENRRRDDRDEERRRRSDEEARENRKQMADLIATLHQRDTASSSSGRGTPVPSMDYQIMPDLTKGIGTFSGDGHGMSGTEWLRQLESVANLHKWPEAFKLESARTHLVGAAHHWFAGGGDDVTTWASFCTNFRATFSTSAGLPLKWRRLTELIQRKGENTHEYFHQKVRYCRDLNLEFDDTKQQIVTGLWSRQACNHLMAQRHTNLKELLADLRSFEEFEAERSENFSNQRTTSATASAAVSAPTRGGGRQQQQQQQQQQTPPHQESWRHQLPPRNQLAVGESPSHNSIKCYNCNDGGHLSKDCPQPRRAPVCYKCNLEGHLARNCTTVTTAATSQQLAVTVNRTQNVIAASASATPVKYLKQVTVNGDFSILGLIDCGSSSCTMQASVACAGGFALETPTCDFYGFGDTLTPAVKAIGCFDANLTIDGVLGGPITVWVVPDNAQGTAMIIGRSYTDLAHVAYLKIDNRLLIGEKDVFPFRDLKLPPLKAKVTVSAQQEQLLSQSTVNFVEIGATGDAQTSGQPSHMLTVEVSRQREAEERRLREVEGRRQREVSRQREVDELRQQVVAERQRREAEESRTKEEITMLTLELKKASNQMLVEGLRMECKLEAEKRIHKEKLARLQQLVRDTVEESNSIRDKHDIEILHLCQANDRLKHENEELRTQQVAQQACEYEKQVVSNERTADRYPDDQSNTWREKEGRQAYTDVTAQVTELTSLSQHCEQVQQDLSRCRKEEDGLVVKRSAIPSICGTKRMPRGQWDPGDGDAADRATDRVAERAAEGGADRAAGGDADRDADGDADRAAGNQDDRAVPESDGRPKRDTRRPAHLQNFL